jgi:alpha-beta hydrolase superfamily lysophospholipase
VPKRTKEIQESLLKNISRITCEKTGGTLEIGMYLPRKADVSTPDKSAILFFGGNAQDNMVKVDFLDRIAQQTQLRVFTVSYPGYGESEGGRWFSNTIDNSHASADALVKQLQSEGYVNFFPIGWSFGAAIAAKVAENYKTPLLALYSPFFSAKKAVKYITSQHSSTAIQNYIIDPLTNIALSESTLNNGEILENINHNISVLIAHGKFDNIVDYQDSEDLNKIMENNENIEPTFHTIALGDHISPLTDNTPTDLFIHKVNTKMAEIRKYN